MNKAELVPHIQRSWTYAKALGIGEIFSGPTALNASDQFKATAIDPDATYEALYLLGLHEGQYNILLSDFAFFQFGGGTDGVRFAYYPNPFLGASAEAVRELREMREYVDEGIIDMEEFLHQVADIRKPQHPPVVRYEYSKKQYVEATHPCSHFHIGFHSENRWPVKRFLTAHAFALFIFRTFYLDLWIKAPPLKNGEMEISMDAALEGARSDSRVLYDSEFSVAEGKRFHFI